MSIRISQNDEEIFRYRTNEYLALGTAAIQVDNQIWIGGLWANASPSSRIRSRERPT